MSVITPKNKLSQKEYYASHSLKELAKNSLYISLMFGQVLWPMNSAMAAPVFEPGEPGDGVEQTGSNEYTVTANRAIARWQSFVLGETEKIEFLNNSDQGKILLNLVEPGAIFQISGELNANNIQFILVGPSGISIADSAKIDVSGLVLSTIDVTGKAQKDFKETGNLFFDSSSNGKIIIDSDATLVPSNLENVVLIGKDIQNNANIEASGLVAMLATDKATLNFEGSNTLGVSFNALALIDDANFVNNGTIIADRAFLASLAKNQAININKDIKANQIVISGDKIELSAGLSSNGSGSSLKIGKGVTNFNGQNLTAATELTLKKNDAVIQEMPSSEIQVKKLIVSAEATAFNSAQTEGNHKASLNDFGIVEKVEQISFEHNNGGLTTSASANLETDKHALTTQNITFTGINKADLQNNTLTASTAQNSFNVTGSKVLTAADIEFTEVASVAGDNNQGQVITGADANLETDKHALTTQNITFTGINKADLQNNALTASTAQNSFNVAGSKALTAADIDFTEVASVVGDDNQGHVITNADGNLAADKHALTTQGIGFTGIGSAALGGNKLTASTEQNSFNVTGSKALTAADIDFTEVASVTGNSNQGHVITNADANLAADKHALTSQNIIFTGIGSAALGGNKLTASTAQNSFSVTGSKALTAADIKFTDVASVTGNSNQGHVITNADANLEADKHALTTQGIGFTDIGSMDLNGQSLIGSEHNDSFQILVDGVKANGIKTTNLNRTINANGAVILSGAQNNIWQLMDMKGELKDSRDNGFIFIGVNAANIQGETLNASAAQNKFDITGAQKLTAADINFTGVTSVVGDNNQGQVTTNADANLAADKHALTSQNIIFTGIGSAALGGNKLTASTEQNSFSVTGSKALTAADIEFTGVASVTDNSNQGHVITNADANLEADKHALTTQGIGFTGIGSMDLNGQSLIGSEHDDSFQILVDGVKANGIKTTNLNRTINANGAVTLSGAQNNIWQLMDMKGELKDSRDNGFIFIGVNAANLQGETLNASAAQNKFDITGAQKLTAADIDFSNVAEVNVYDNKGYVITNNVAELTDGKNQLKTQGVIINGVDQAYLSNNALKGSETGSTLELISESRVDASGIKFFDFGELDGNKNTGALVSKLDAPQWTMKTANSGTVNNIKFKAFKTLENSVGDLKLNVGEKVGGVEFKGDNLNFGGNSSLVFNSQNNVTVNSTNNINGSLVAKDLNINTTGDVDLKTQIDSITLNANNANLVQDGDLVIHSIDVGRTLNLNSADAGKNNLIAGNSGRINVKAKASLGEQGKWDNIGVNAQPLSFEVVSELALVANTTVAPLFPNGQPPIFNLEGDRSESLLSSHTNALIQNNRVSNDANANLALFEALSPIYIDKNAVAGVHVKDSRLDVPSELEMEMLAALLSKENPTAAGKPNKKKVLEKDDADET